MASRKAPDDALTRYREKRNFAQTPEPDGGVEAASGALRFVIHKHWATRLHYDLRLELNGTKKSWAVPKGPSLDPKLKRMAVEVEDHPISYNSFEGQIPPGQYGAGRVILWDRGHWLAQGDAAAGFKKGHLKFSLQGEKLHGNWALVRMQGPRANPKKPVWLLIKERDHAARDCDEYDVTKALPDSVNTPPATTATGTKPAARAQDQPTRQAKQATQPGTPAAAKTPAIAHATPAAPASALRSAVPDQLLPQLASLADGPPANAAGWRYELKFDGYRILARMDARGGVRLFTRNGHDWTDKLPELQQALGGLALQSSWLDGELTATGDNGAPDFQRLQNAFDNAGTANLLYTVFDLPFHDGHDLRQQPLSERRAQLQALLQAQDGEREGEGHGQGSMLRFSAAFDAHPRDLVASACTLGFEGVIGKRQDAPYVSGRSNAWIKLKCGLRQEFVVLGFTPPQGARTGLGSLLLGVHNRQGQLVYAGKVGTGFSDAALERLRTQLQALEQDHCPLATTPPASHHAQWLNPALVAEVAFAGWTRGGHVRHAVFKGLRTDKPAQDIVREQPQAPASGAAAAAIPPSAQQPNRCHQRAPALPDDLQLSHGERVIDRSTGTTKRELARHYATVAPLMMEHLHQRPVALVRAPKGVGGETFFQKHGDADRLPGITALPPGLEPGHGPLLTVSAAEGLLAAAQLNVIEFHTWNARADRMDRPDRITFDLDTGEGVSFDAVREGAELVHVLLRELGLPAFVKTSGGKGLHVVVPVKRLRDWDTTKAFSQAVVQHLADTIPARFVAKSGPRNRVGKIFVDYLRNGRGATTVSAWSARARPGMGVSVPVAWAELPHINSGAHWTVATLDERLRIGNAPWKGYADAAVALGDAMRLLAWQPGR